MGWGTDFKISIYLNKILFANRYEVEDKIEETKKWIEREKNKIKMLISSNVKDIIPEEWKDTPIDWLINKYNSINEQIEEETFFLFKLELYLEYLKENNITVIKLEE